MKTIKEDNAMSKKYQLIKYYEMDGHFEEKVLADEVFMDEVVGIVEESETHTETEIDGFVDAVKGMYDGIRREYCYARYELYPINS